MNEIWGQLTRSPKLPTPPQVALEVLRMTGRDDIGVAEVAELIRKDTALSARVLKTVNRAYYGARRQVSSVRQAAALLGLRALKLVALRFTVLSAAEAQGLGGVNFEAHWRRNLSCGTFASRLAERIGFEPVDEAYIAAWRTRTRRSASACCTGSRWSSST